MKQEFNQTPKYFGIKFDWTPTRVPGLPIRDCARGCTNRGQSRPIMSAIDVTAKTVFERLYLVLGLCIIAPWVNCPCAPTTPTVHCTTISQFPCNFFPRMAPHFFDHHDSPSNLAKSRYPHSSSEIHHFRFRIAAGLIVTKISFHVCFVWDLNHIGARRYFAVCCRWLALWWGDWRG